MKHTYKHQETKLRKYKLCNPATTPPPESPLLQRSENIINNCKIQTSFIEYTGEDKNKYAIETIKFREDEKNLEKCCISIQ